MAIAAGQSRHDTRPQTPGQWGSHCRLQRLCRQSTCQGAGDCAGSLPRLQQLRLWTPLSRVAPHRYACGCISRVCLLPVQRCLRVGSAVVSVPWCCRCSSLHAIVGCMYACIGVPDAARVPTTSSWMFADPDSPPPRPLPQPPSPPLPSLPPCTQPPPEVKVDIEGVVVLPVTKGVKCLRGVCNERLKYEVEYSLKKGTSENSYLLQVGRYGCMYTGGSWCRPGGVQRGGGCVCVCRQCKAARDGVSTNNAQQTPVTISIYVFALFAAHPTHACLLFYSRDKPTNTQQGGSGSQKYNVLIDVPFKAFSDAFCELVRGGCYVCCWSHTRVCVHHAPCASCLLDTAAHTCSLPLPCVRSLPACCSTASHHPSTSHCLCPLTLLLPCTLPLPLPNTPTSIHPYLQCLCCVARCPQLSSPTSSSPTWAPTASQHSRQCSQRQWQTGLQGRAHSSWWSQTRQRRHCRRDWQVCRRGVCFVLLAR